MKLYRIAKTSHISDLSGEGARLHGGRWNQKGTPLVYTSGSRALAALEYLVHVPMALAPTHLSVMEIGLPDAIASESIELSSLPPDWRDYPPPEALPALGTDWARSNRSLLLRVPSAVVQEEFNYLINPAHPDSRFIASHTEPFVFDRRLFP